MEILADTTVFIDLWRNRSHPERLAELDAIQDTRTRNNASLPFPAQRLGDSVATSPATTAHHLSPRPFAPAEDRNKKTPERPVRSGAFVWTHLAYNYIAICETGSLQSL